MGAAYTPICGQFLCGQTRVATWRTTWDTPEIDLNARTFSVSIFAGQLISLSVNRPVLFLRSTHFDFLKDTALVFTGKPLLTLKAAHYDIGPFLAVYPGRAVLYLRGKLAVLAVSSSPHFNRPVLYLLGGLLARVGRAGLSPTVPESRPLTPIACVPATLTAHACESRTLVATATGTQPLTATTCVDGEDLLVPTEVEVR